MAKKAYVGVNNVSKSIKDIYIGVDNIARKVKKGYIGVDGVARLFWESETPLAATLRYGPKYGIPSTPFYFHMNATGGKLPYRYAYTMSRNSSAYETIAGLTSAAAEYNAFQTGTFAFRATVTDDDGASITIGTDDYMIRATNDAALNLTLAASRNAETGIATWTLSSSTAGARQYSISVFKDGVIYRSMSGTNELSMPLTEPGLYTAIGSMYMLDLSTARTVNANTITVT